MCECVNETRSASKRLKQNMCGRERKRGGGVISSGIWKRRRDRDVVKSSE